MSSVGLSGLRIGKIESKELLPENKHKRYGINDDADAVIRMAPKQSPSPNDNYKNNNGLPWLNTTVATTTDTENENHNQVQHDVEMRVVVGGVLSTSGQTDNGNNNNNKNDDDDDVLYADDNQEDVNVDDMYIMDDHDQQVLEALKTQNGNKTASYADEGRDQEHETGYQQPNEVN